MPKRVWGQGCGHPSSRDFQASGYYIVLSLIQIVKDIGVVDDSIRLVKETVQQLGGLDIIINNVGWTRFANFGDINDLTHDEWNKCWSINVMSQLVLMQEAAPIFNANPEGGVFIISSSVAGKSCSGSSMGYSVTKAAGLHLMKCLASTQGPKIRINAVLPGLLLTEWGLRYGEERIEATKNRAALKREVGSVQTLSFPVSHE
ncbi:hypothetical protein A1O1_07747 [Capronia coronata CBS 617.96]|uniref:Alcohol dehydrogenase n=1 Tax=Capronia coronata CBS 617.96 TaxID=1182541 RepID=W9XMB6_9EURO|nr:uncharacterized protein A1O1_07747 [Capronia coronata CBS 617.96]EXJ81682.1 hypothetical protein A1O1_07747 [Capronia coronata CBS 617.96]